MADAAQGGILQHFSFFFLFSFFYRKRNKIPGCARPESEPWELPPALELVRLQPAAAPRVSAGAGSSRALGRAVGKPRWFPCGASPGGPALLPAVATGAFPPEPSSKSLTPQFSLKQIPARI